MNRELIKIDLSTHALIERKLVDNLLEAAATAQKHGLVLTETMAKEIVASREQTLKDNDRVDFSSDTVTRLVKAFSESYYITQETFSETICEIIELFYFLKNEINDVISDDDMIREMLIVFNETCFGVMEIMQSKGVEKIVRKYRFGDTGIWADYENPHRRFKFGTGDVWDDYEKLEDKWEHGETWRE